MVKVKESTMSGGRRMASLLANSAAPAAPPFGRGSMWPQDHKSPAEREQEELEKKREVERVRKKLIGKKRHAKRYRRGANHIR